MSKHKKKGRHQKLEASAVINKNIQKRVNSVVQDSAPKASKRTDGALVSTTAQNDTASLHTKEVAVTKVMQLEEGKDEIGHTKTMSKNINYAKKRICKSCSRVKKLTSWLILISGLAIGSFFVDSAQFFTQRGLSARALNEAQVVSYDGATWVKYNEPKVVVDVFRTHECGEKCDIADEILSQVRRFIPTLEAHTVDTDTSDGRAYARQKGIRYVPEFFFEKTLAETRFYTQAAALFVPREDGSYSLDLDAIDVPIGMYIDAPSTMNGIAIGAEKENAAVTIVFFNDFACHSCAQIHTTLRALQEKYPDYIRVIYKNSALAGIPSSRGAALAIGCAYDQNVFVQYADILYNDRRWRDKDRSTRDKLFATYAHTVGIPDIDSFAQCVQQQDFENDLIAVSNEADSFGIVGKGQIFINGKFFVVDEKDTSTLQTTIEELIALSIQNANL